ncbi:MAG: hybrid sensor histidine kinase/response regulator [Anaerolineae bacterium]
MTEDHKPEANLLVIDDEASLREGCRRALAPVGYSVDTAADLITGQELLQSKTYDLILLDVMLPDGNGLDLIEPILDKDPNAICVVMTGYGSIQMAVEAVRRGAYDFLAKPFTSEELLIAVGQGLERRRLKATEARAKELAQAKAELEQLDKVKSQLMLKVAHELRAPVAAVRSYINLILSGYVTADELTPTLSRVQDRLKEMLDLISDLLELAQLRQPREQAIGEVKPQPMAEILREVSELFQEQVSEKNLDFQIEILDQPVILAQRDHLKQIWTNLISNAVKYTPEGGRIAITLEAEEGKVTGTVTDSGMGITEADMPHLFQDFFRTDQAKASGEMGTGLGLAIVKQIVDSYGGEIQVSSKLGQGSRFTFVLPQEPTPMEG